MFYGLYQYRPSYPCRLVVPTGMRSFLKGDNGDTHKRKEKGGPEIKRKSTTTKFSKLCYKATKNIKMTSNRLLGSYHLLLNRKMTPFYIIVCGGVENVLHITTSHC